MASEDFYVLLLCDFYVLLIPLLLCSTDEKNTGLKLYEAEWMMNLNFWVSYSSKMASGMHYRALLFINLFLDILRVIINNSNVL